jgi:flavorubredoxin
MPTQVLYKDGSHQNVLLEDFTSGQMVQSNQHVILHNEQAMLLDPGGHKVYSFALSEISSLIQTSALRYIFFSHQDPDIIAAANGWLMITEAEGLLSNLWMRFITHFGVDEMVMDRIHAIPDEGMHVDLGGCDLQLIPAHFLHSPGNFQIYDPVSKILYSGDLGASLGQTYVEVNNFNDHIQYIEGFHQRYMASNRTLRSWLKMVRQLDVELIAPQHGAFFRGKEVINQFYNWLENLSCGVDLLDDAYQLPE